MNKKILLFSLLLLFCLALPISLGAGYFEDFEDGLMGNWTESTGHVEVADFGYDGSSHSLKVNYQGANAAAVMDGFTFEGGMTGANIVKFGFMFYANDTTAKSIWNIRNNAENSYVSYNFMVNDDLTNPGTICTNCFSDNTWANVTYFYDMSSKTYDVYVDSVLKGNDVAFHQGTPSDMGYIQLYAYSGTDNFYDDINIEWSGNEVVPNYNLSFYSTKESLTNYTVTLSNGTYYNSGGNRNLVLPINVTGDYSFTITQPNYFSLSEASYSYNSSLDENYNFNLTKWNNILVQAKHNGSYIPFNATLNGDSYSSNNGTLYHPINSSVTYNITNGAYFDRTGNFTGSNNLTTYLYQSYITFNATELLTNNELTGVTYAIGSNTDTIKFLATGWYNVTAVKSGYFNKTKEFEVNAKDNTTITIEDMSGTIVNIRFNDSYTGAFIEVDYEVTLDGYSWTTTGTATNVTIYALQNYNFTIKATNSEYANTYYNFTPTSTETNFTVPMEPVALWVSFSNTTTGRVTGINYSYNFSGTSLFIKQSAFATGKVGVEWNNLQIAEYYNDRNTPFKANLWVIPINETLDVARTFKVVESGVPLHNARVTAEQWRNGKWQIIYAKLTNINGEAVLNLQGDTVYRITYQKNGYVSESTIFSITSGDTTTEITSLEQSTSNTYSSIRTSCHPTEYFPQNCTYITQCFDWSCSGNIYIYENTTTGISSTSSSFISTTQNKIAYTYENTTYNATIIIVLSDGTTKTFAISQYGQSTHTIMPDRANYQGRQLLGIIFVILSGTLIAFAFESKISKGTGIYVFAIYLLFWGIIMPVLFIPGFIIIITKLTIPLIKKLQNTN